MKILNKTISATLAVMMLASTMSVTAFADENSSEKQEVIYVMTSADGTVENMYVVNIFENGEITDYGDYSDVKLLTISDSITQEGDKITFTNSADKAYLQGTLKNGKLPWNISISYFLDGEEYTAEEIVGKSGRLEIKFNVEKNDECNIDFYDAIALQASFTLDTDICSNISADGATLANVGAKKQISYTILPGNGIDTSITADVQNFEMESVAINGVKLNMNVDIDKSQLTENTNELTDGIAKIDDGVKELADGSTSLKDASKSAKDGSDELVSGVDSLNSGMKTLSTGVDTLQSGIDELTSKSNSLTFGSSQVKTALSTIQTSLDGVSADSENLKKLVASSSDIMSAISSLKTGSDTLRTSLSYESYKTLMTSNGLDIDTLKATNENTISALTAQIETLNNTISQLSQIPDCAEQVTQLQTQIESLSGIIKLLNGNNAAIGGTEQYLNTLSTGAEELSTGLANLETAYTQFNTAISGLVNQLSTMLTNINTLSDGIDTLVAQYSTLDTGISAYTDGLSKVASGYKQISSSISELASGSKTLLSGANELDSGLSDLYDGTVTLSDGVDTLSSGTGELKEKTTGIDTQIDEKINDVLTEIKGKDIGNVSFVSDKNENVESVQFVIKTKAIEIPEAEETEPKEECKLTFWQKLLKLFGIDV